jgi:hypothetical protein
MRYLLAIVLMFGLHGIAPASADTCNIIDGPATFGNPCTCPSGTTKKPIPNNAGFFICDDGTGAADNLIKGNVCCLATSGAGTNQCSLSGAKYMWMTRDQCMGSPGFGLKVMCPAASCRP